MKRKKDWVDKLIDSGLTGHVPKRKKFRKVHRHKYDQCQCSVPGNRCNTRPKRDYGRCVLKKNFCKCGAKKP